MLGAGAGGKGLTVARSPINPLATRAQGRFLVTGATGGLGRALCAELLQRLQPRVLYAHGRDEAKLARLRQELGHAAVRCCRLALDDERELAALSASIAAEAGGLDLWLHCVGALHGGAMRAEKSLRDVDAAGLTAAFHTNTVLFLLTAKHLKPLLREAGGAVIAALSAKVGSIGDNQLGGWYGYRASKAALNMSVRTFALELSRNGSAAICVAIHPGTTATELSAPFTAGYSAERLYTPQVSAKRIVDVLVKLQAADHGSFRNWDGQALPW